MSAYPLRQDPSARLVEALGEDVAGKIFPFHYRQGDTGVYPGHGVCNCRDALLPVHPFFTRQALQE